MALLMPATPIVVLILSRILYSEPIPGRRLLGMLTAMLGILLLLSRGDWQKIASLQFNSGDLWTLGSMLCFALYSLFIRQRPKEISPLSFNAAVFALGIIYALPCVVLEALWLPLPKITSSVLIGVCYSGIGCSALAFWLWTCGIDRIGPVRASIIYYSLPVFAGIESVLILQETVLPVQIVGGLLIIGGICVATVFGRH